jgi:hypothetical protein
LSVEQGAVENLWMIGASPVDRQSAKKKFGRVAPLKSPHQTPVDAAFGCAFA